MGAVDLRDFLKLLGAPAAAAAIPIDLEKVLAIEAKNKIGSIDDVEHVIFLFQ
jgi:phospholipase C